MAMAVHLWMKAGGNVVEGESTIHNEGREGSIECLSFSDGVRTAREASSGMATGDRTYEPIVIQKRIDRSSPLLAKALCDNEVIEGTFKFYRLCHDSGQSEHFFTVKIAEGRIAGIYRDSPDVCDPASAHLPAREKVSFVFGDITWTYESHGIEHQDTWSRRR